jgi:hypothetical protein
MRAAEVALTDEQRTTLRSWLAAGKTERRLAFRAQIILAVADGLSNKAAADRLATRPATVSKWRGRFCAARPSRGGGCATQRQAAALRRQG